MSKSNYQYPFVAIVGQDSLKRALILNAINPSIGGVLIRGEKGTAKSTAVRSLASNLPKIEVVKNDPFQSDPKNPESPFCLSVLAEKQSLNTEIRSVKVVELPLSATEDRVVGSLNLESALKDGVKKVEPGILAEAHRGILYVDEVNLLEDHLVDLLLDSAAMGVNSIERDGVSFSHPSKFTLVGTMNPEEGELRPQFLDRFGLSVLVEGICDIQERVEIIKRRAEFDENPEAFIDKWKEDSDNLSSTIENAQEILPNIEVSDSMYERIVKNSLERGVDGHRSDIVMLKTAKTLCAFYGRMSVQDSDIDEAAKYVLPHRVRRQPFETIQ